MRIISQTYSGQKLLAARSIYLALTEIASNQFTPTRAHTSCAYLGILAGMKEAAARRYIHEFARLGLIEVVPGVHQANTYILLGEAPTPLDNLAGAAMPLADGVGQSFSMATDSGTHGLAGVVPRHQVSANALNGAVRGIPGDRDIASPAPQVGKSRAARGAAGESLTHDVAVIGRSSATARDVAGDPPHQAAAEHSTTARGIRRDRQITRISESKNQKQPTNRGGVDVPVGEVSCETFRAEQLGSVLLIANVSPLNNEQMQAAQSLTGIGVRRARAEEVVRQHDSSEILAWVRYALRCGGLKSRAGFVLSRLATGETPPDYPPSGAATWQTSPATPTVQQPSWGLTEASAELRPDGEAANGQRATADAQSGDAPNESKQEEASSAIDNSTVEARLWRVAREELHKALPQAVWTLWLEQVQLVACAGGEVWLAGPPVGVAGQYARRYGPEIQQALSGVMMREVEIRWMAGSRRQD